jgi:predicted DsbA family dithiol-disulfide isomerase
MNGGASGERIPVQFYFDYICPFCYVGSERLDRLVARYPVTVQYRFVEIHPDNPPEGRPLSELGYPPAQWQQMMRSLHSMAVEDGLPLAERTFTTNSRRAILLAQTVLAHRPEAFQALHRALFRAYFVDALNIGAPEVLQSLAARHDVDDLLSTAWETREPVQLFLEHVEAARRLGLTGVPTLVVGPRAFPGAVSLATLEAALEHEGVRPLTEA